MAKNLVIKNPDGVKQVYQNVESIVLKDTDNNNVEYIEKPVKTTGKYHCMVIDYDGTVLKDEWHNTGDVFTMPTPPEHERLTFQEWSCSQELTDNQTIVNNNNIMAGPFYETTSGLLEVDIELNKGTGLEVTFNFTGDKNWGDGTIDSLKSHTYSEYGKYIITCNVNEQLSSSLFEATFSSPNYYCIGIRLPNTISMLSSLQHCGSIKYISISKNTTFSKFGLMGCYSLRGLVLPNIRTYYTNLFQADYKLEYVVIPNNSTVIPNAMFQDCGLSSVSIPNSVTLIDSNAFNGNKKMEHIVIPTGVETINSNVFNSCFNLDDVTFYGNLQTLGSNVFYCQKICNYDFSKSTIVPTITSTSFRYFNKLSKIIVPDALYDEWVSATNWVTYSNYIYKASEVNADA